MTLSSQMIRNSAAVAAAFAVSALAGADCVRLVSENTPGAPNAFTLDFGPFGGTRQANITLSEITLETCDSTGEARFTDYYQEVGELILPDGTSTGELTILVNPSRPQSYNPITGEFTTDDDYSIYFAGDLSAYGIQPPFSFQHQSSSGVIAYETATTGTIAMNWAGSSALPNPFVPGEYIPFSYTCSVNVSFRVDAGCAGGACTGDLDGDCEVGLGDLATQLTNFGTTGARVRPYEGDVDGDLDVDLTDLANLLSNFGSDCN